MVGDAEADPIGAIDKALEMIDTIEAKHPGIYGRGRAFFEDVRKKLGDVRETIEDRGFATNNQVVAIQNWGDAIERWLPK